MEKRYNDSQVKAIGHFNGGALPWKSRLRKDSGHYGADKKLITKYHVNPSNILVITFTKAANIGNEDPFLKSDGKRFVSGHIWNIPRRLF